MALPSVLLDIVFDSLRGHLKRSVTVHDAVPVTGGSISDAYRLDTSSGPFLLKVNTQDRVPSFFEAETDGLELLRSTGAVRVPQVVVSGVIEESGFLVLEYIAEAPPTSGSWEELGRSLATLHQHTAPLFGLERDNYIGPLKQVNDQQDDWATFFTRMRLEPLVRTARDRGRIGDGTVLRFERLLAQLDGLFPKEPPALLHGDLWDGNLLFDDVGTPVLIDPAVYYGHREMDLAMLQLFGGADPGLFAAYNDVHPLAPGWEDRVALCNLYPLLVHVNLFGGGYVTQLDEALKRFL